MRLCKDCWHCWIEKGICCHEKAKRDFMTGECIASIYKMRSTGECESSGKLWRPKQFSPNKIYQIAIECPDCKKIFLYDLYSEDSGKRECRKCKREIWFPYYGVNLPDKNKLMKEFGITRYQIENWKYFVEDFK